MTASVYRKPRTWSRRFAGKRKAVIRGMAVVIWVSASDAVRVPPAATKAAEALCKLYEASNDEEIVVMLASWSARERGGGAIRYGEIDDVLADTSDDFAEEYGTFLAESVLHGRGHPRRWSGRTPRINVPSFEVELVDGELVWSGHANARTR